jgi:redox-sensing transcriptional repressor
MDTSTSIPEIIVGRLPVYLQALEHMHNQGILTTSSQELGKVIGISAAQIRKDLSQFGEFGKQGKGYSVPFLVNQLRSILRVDRIWDIVVVGAGNLGHAIANYQGFINHGFRVAMIFDNSTEQIGTRVGEITVQDISNMISAIQRERIQVAMLTVPASSAQSVADDLVKAGIKSILNYAPITLSVPPGVHVQYVDPVIYLQRMSYYLE